MSLLLAQYILPITKPPLSPGYIRIQGDSIVEMGEGFPSSNEETIDLGACVLLPAFVNAHCHLELTALNPLLRAKEVHSDFFVDWIRTLVEAKNKLSPEKILGGIRSGFKTLAQSGVATIGDHISWDTPLAAHLESPLQGILFGEVLGVLPEVSADLYSHLKALKSSFSSERWVLNPSPHSVHAVAGATLKEILTSEEGPLSIHLGESQAEEDYFLREGGKLREFIASRGVHFFHRAPSGLQWLERECGHLDKLLPVHGNYLSLEDLKIIQNYRLSLVHCPGSHDYFGHKPFPVKDYLKKGINLALGTDSLASNTGLNFLEELRLLGCKEPQLTGEEILKMATLGGAKALRLEKQIGTLEMGKKATLVGFSMKGKDFYESIFSSHQAAFLMVNGKRII